MASEQPALRFRPGMTVALIASLLFYAVIFGPPVAALVTWLSS